MKTNRYVIQSAVVLGLVALLTVPQVVGYVDEERHQYQRPLLKLLQSPLMMGRQLICRFCQQQTFIPTWLTMTIIKISRLKPLVCLKLMSLSKKARETNPNTVLVDSGDTIQGIPFGTYKALIDPVTQGETHPIYKAFEMLGYDDETLGNHEFNYGLEFLDHMVKAAKINIINVNVRNAQTGDYYYNPYKIVNKTFTDTDSKQKVVNSKAKLEKNDTKSDIADKDLIDMAAYDHNGTSTQAGFAEYRLIVKEKANQVDDTTNKESEKSPKGVGTTDQSKREISKATVVTSLAKSATTIQLLNSKVIIQPQA